MNKTKIKVIAVDFDGTLCTYKFPGIGAQTKDQKDLLNKLIDLQQRDIKLILWTNRGDNDKYKSLSAAVAWCKERGLVFDSINENIPGQEKKSGYSPKVMADLYIDDKAVHISDWRNFLHE